LDALAKCQGVRKVAAADHTGKTADDSRNRLGDRFDSFFDDPHRMLEESKPALTVITMEGHRSPAAIDAALAADSHVLTEKPGCVKLEDLERVVRLAEKKKRQVMLAMATRTSAAVKKARQLISDGLLGKPYSATMDWGPALLPGSNRRRDRKDRVANHQFGITSCAEGRLRRLPRGGIRNDSNGDLGGTS